MWNKQKKHWGIELIEEYSSFLILVRNFAEEQKVNGYIVSHALGMWTAKVAYFFLIVHIATKMIEMSLVNM